MLLYWAYVIYTQGGAIVPCKTFSDVVAPYCALSVHIGTARCLLVLS